MTQTASASGTITGRSSSGQVAFPEPGAFDELSRKSMLEVVELQAGERGIPALQLPAQPIIIFDPVTHTAHFIEVAGEPTRERQELSLVFSSARAGVGRTAMHPGPLRLSLDNRTGGGSCQASS
jgi:hypothetical protein